MRRKALQGVANTLCHMVDGDGRYRDETLLARLGSGRLHIDLLHDTVRHDGVALAEPLYLVGRMRAWLRAELRRLRLDPAALRRVEVTVRYTVEPGEWRGTRLWELEYRCESVVATDEAEYHGRPIPGRPSFGGSIPR